MPRVRAAIRPPADGPAPAPAPAPEGSAMSTKRPPVRRATSASAAPALPPTPPRTTHKRKRRSRSRVTDSSSEDDDDHDVPEPEPEHANHHKRRKMSTLEAIAEELSETRAEEQFWLGGAGDGAASSSSAAAGPSSSQSKRKIVKDRAPTRARSRSRTRSPSASPPPAPHLLKRGHTGLFSPPPSRRAPAVVPRPATPPPSTRPQRVKDKAKGYPERDSPNNPFLLDSSPGSVPATDSSPEPHTPKKHVEKPTITVVIRGVRAQMLNPHYVPEDVAAEAEARASLPVRHPDFSPTDACAPKLLFPEARKHDHAYRRREHAEPGSPTPVASTSTSKFTFKSKSTKRSRAGSASSDEPRAPGPSTITEEDADADVAAMSAAIAANIARRMREGALAGGEVPKTRPSSRLGELPDMPELPAKDRSDPVKRALGPPRRG